MPETGGVIHDLGYRGYDGPREGTGAIARALFVTGLRHAYGLGRSGKSKVLPFILLAINLLPAVILVGVLAMFPVGELPISYGRYPSSLQMVVSLFAAAQAPVIFSRDLRSRSIVLYAARPLSTAVFALTRWASLTVAILLFTLAPVLIMYVGGLLAGLDLGDQTPDFLASVALQVLLAMMLAGITGLLSSVALRRGFAVVASIVVLIVVSGVVLILQAIGVEEDVPALAEVAGLLSPWAIHNGLSEALGAGGASIVELGGLWPTAYAVVGLAVSAGCLALVVARFAKAGAR